MTKIDDLHLWRLFCEVVRSDGVNAACENRDEGNLTLHPLS